MHVIGLTLLILMAVYMYSGVLAAEGFSQIHLSISEEKPQTDVKVKTKLLARYISLIKPRAQFITSNKTKRAKSKLSKHTSVPNKTFLAEHKNHLQDVELRRLEKKFYRRSWTYFTTDVEMVMFEESASIQILNVYSLRRTTPLTAEMISATDRYLAA